MTDTETLALISEKQVSDRTSIIIAANAFLFGAFATLLASVNITEFLKAIPIIICGAGIALNVVLGFTNIVQIRKIKDSLAGNNNEFVSKYFNKGKNTDINSILKGFSNCTPIVLIAAWILCMVFYVLQITIGII